MKERERQRQRRSKHIHMHTGETPSAFFKQHQSTGERERERERHSMKMHTIYTKLYQTERRKKWIFRQKSSRVAKEEKNRVRENKRKRDIRFFSVYIRLESQ